MMQFMWLRGPYAEGLEPASESCMKCGRICVEMKGADYTYEIQRRTGVNGVKQDA